MISITKAAKNNYAPIVSIGKISVEEAHRDSCSVEDMQEYLKRNYNDDAIKKDVSDKKNIYHLISYNETPVGFSKIVLNAQHPNISKRNVTKLDRLYLLSEFHGLKLGYKLLRFNIELAKNKNQSGIWLFTWVGNDRAINFYLKTGFTIIGSDKFKVSETHYNLQHQMLLDL